MTFFEELVIVVVKYIIAPLLVAYVMKHFI